MEKNIINLKKDGKTKWKLGNSYFQIFYSGEIKENKPDGFGISEEYVFPTYNDDVYMKNSEYKTAWNNYSKNFIYKDNLSYSLIQRYEGHWKNGKTAPVSGESCPAGWCRQTGRLQFWRHHIGWHVPRAEGQSRRTHPPSADVPASQVQVRHAA